jgi:hypothetical protein
MTIATLYVRAKSKKAINEKLEAGQAVYAESFSLFGGKSGPLHAVAADGDVIKIYEKMVSGSPYAKAYGNWNAKKQRVK